MSAVLLSLIMVFQLLLLPYIMYRLLELFDFLSLLLLIQWVIVTLYILHFVLVNIRK
jgi:hypothetical protein